MPSHEVIITRQPQKVGGKEIGRIVGAASREKYQEFVQNSLPKAI
jgi:hypothetical protein